MIRQKKRAVRNLHERRFMCLTCGSLHDAPKVKGFTAPGHRKVMWCVECKKKRLHIQVEPITMEDKDMAKCLICGKVEPAMRCICGDCLPKRKKCGKLPKAELAAMIEAERAYWVEDAGRTDEEREVLLDVMSAARKALEEKLGYPAYALREFLGGLLGYYGMATDATNQEIYAVLHLMGWEVYEEAESDGSDL